MINKILFFTNHKYYLLILVLLLITSSVVTHFIVPNFLIYSGHGCIQGIDATLSLLLLKVSTFINIIALLCFYYPKSYRAAKIIAFIALLIWCLSILLLKTKYLLESLFYFSPYFMVSLLIFLSPNKKTSA